MHSKADPSLRSAYGVEGLESRRLLAGEFAATTNISVGTFPYGVAAGDFNGDGKADIAVANDNSDFGGNFYGNATVRLGNGNGTFATAATYSTSLTRGAYALTTADFNHDGRLDLAVANSGPQNTIGTVSVLLNTGNGTFGAATEYTAGANPFQITSGDFNGDGNPDLAVANSYGSTITILLGSASGTFAAAPAVSVGNYPQGVFAADFNGDGKSDLVTSGGGYARVILGNASGTLTVANSYVASFGASAATAGDFNNDGKIDIVVANYTSPGKIAIRLGRGDGTFSALGGEVTVGGAPRRLVPADFNGDGKLDLATANVLDSTVSVLLGRGTGSFAPAFAVAAGGTPLDMATADFNADGKPDLILPTTSGPGYATLLLNQAVPAAAASTYVNLSGGVLSINNAGATDLLIAAGRLEVTSPDGIDSFAVSSVTGIVVNGNTTASFDSDLGPATGNGTVSVTINSGATAYFGSEHLANLTVNGTVLMPSQYYFMLRVTGLTIGAGGKLDLNQSLFIDDYSGTTPQAPAIRNLLYTGRADGAWNGNGITSTYIKGLTAGRYALGYMEASDYIAAYGNPKFNGEPIDSTAVIERFTLTGDTDFDTGVSINDFNRLAGAFGTTGKTWLAGDFDYDGGVSINDFNLLAGNFGKTLATAAPRPTASSAHATAVKSGVRPGSGTVFSSRPIGVANDRYSFLPSSTIWRRLDSDSQ